MSSLLSSLGTKTKATVGISVSLNVGLEMIQVDPATKTIVQYANRPLAYNPSTREIEDYNQFKTSVIELFSELGISPQDSNVVVNLPSVHFAHIYLPTTLDDGDVTTALTSEVEQNYLFKKNTPVVSWREVSSNNNTENRYVLYSAIQEGVVEAIKTIFSDIGATLIAIENTYSSLLKTLEYTEIAKNFAQGSKNWNILLVSQNSYAIFAMNKYNVIDYFEDPLALKSFSNDEVYIAVGQAASAALAKYPSDRLMIISETNYISAEILAIQMKRAGEVIFLECNKYAKNSIMNVNLNILPNYVPLITPEAIGAAIYKAKDFSIAFNFLATSDYVAPDTVDFFGYEVEKSKITYLLLFCIVVIAGISYFAMTSLDSYTGKLQAEKSQLETQQKTLQQELEDLKQNKGKVDIYTASKRIMENMTSTVSYYGAIGVDIPQKVWLNKFYADDKGSFAIEGETVSVDDVYLFFRGLKEQVPNSSLILSKLGVRDDDVYVDIEQATDVVYKFELTNSNYVKEKAKAAAQAAALAGVDENGNPIPVDPNAPAAPAGDVQPVQDLPTLQ